jgi:signal transduction histidine kinase
MRLRLVLSYILVVLVAIASVLLLARQGAASEVRMFMGGSMMGLDQLAADLEAYYQATGAWQGAEALIESARMGHGNGMMGGAGPRLRLADARGNVIADTLGIPRGRLSTGDRQAAIQLHGSRGVIAGYLVAEGGGGSETALLQRLVRAGLIAAAISLALSIILSLVLSYGMLQPIQALTQAAARMSGGDLSQRVKPRGGDELGTLGKAFNQMAVSLQRAENNRRAMTADIAHELRTPIAIQRAHLEALQDGVYPLTMENLAPVLEQTDLLTRLVEDLRTLALADSGELRLEISPTDLPGLVRRVVDRFYPEAESRQVELAVKNTAGVLEPLPLDPDRLEQILNNLVSNALRYTPDGGRIEVEIACEAAWAELRVADSGPGISEEALSKVFERFYRADPARSRAGGSTGLGLAIARQLALAHGGDLSAANRPGGGALFTLRLPARRPGEAKSAPAVMKPGQSA